MIWTLQVRVPGGRWSSRIQCDDRERLERHADDLGYRETRVVRQKHNPERITENRHGVLRRAGLKQW